VWRQVSRCQPPGHVHMENRALVWRGRPARLEPPQVPICAKFDRSSIGVLGSSLAAGCHQLLAQQKHLFRVGLFERVEHGVDSFVADSAVGLDHKCLIGIGSDHE